MINKLLPYLFAFAITSAFVYVLLRFGPVDYTWLRLTKDEGRKLRSDFREYEKAHKPFRPKPSGKILYKKKMISHNGLIVYSNGLYAKFCLGRKGRYRFIPFEEISGIYPVNVENPFTKRDSRWMGLKSWKMLQIETKGNLVLLVNSTKHDFNRVIPILKSALGGYWKGLHKEDETIVGNLLLGDIGKHKILRGVSQILTPQTFRKGQVTSEQPNVINLKAGWNSSLCIKIPKKQIIKLRLLTFGGGGLVLVLGLIGSYCKRMYGYFCIFIGAIVIFLGLFVEWAKGKQSLQGTSIDFNPNEENRTHFLCENFLKEHDLQYTYVKESYGIVSGSGYELLPSGIRLIVFNVNVPMIGLSGRCTRLGIRNINENTLQEAIRLHIDLDEYLIQNNLVGHNPFNKETKYVWDGVKYTPLM